MNMKVVFVALAISMLFIASLEDVHFVKADSNSSMGFSGGVTLTSPVNKTYDYIPILSLNLAEEGVPCTLNYSIDGINEGVIPLVYVGSEETIFIANMSGTAQLPQLSVGTHCLTITEEANLNDYRGPSPPGAPFTETSAGSGNYFAVWVDTVYFTITSNSVRMTPPLASALLDTSPLKITNLSVANTTYLTGNVPLNFTINGNTSQITYSLDEQANVTIPGNTTLTGLSVGAHNVTVYAWDIDSGNIGASQTANFNLASLISAVVQPSQPFTITTVLAVLAAFEVGGVLTFLFFFRKDKR